MKVLVCAAVLVGWGCSRGPEPKQYQLIGQIVSMAPERREVTIKHQDIPKFMPGMTMPFTVEDSALLDGKQAGDLVTFTVDGPAEWRGGIAQGPDNYILAKTLPVECGVNRVLLRSTTKPGKVTVRATAAGLKSAELALDTVAVPAAVSAGVYPRLPADGLAPSFIRETPPASPSYRVTRTPVAIASAKGGGNTEKIDQAYDDNEESSWSNGDVAGGAWAEFTLSRASKLTELTVKLPGWRSRTYPLQVTLDGQVMNGSAGTDPFEHWSSRQIDRYQVHRTHSHITTTPRHGHSLGGAAQIHLMTDKGGWRVCDIDDGQPRGPIRDGDEIAGGGDTLRDARRVDLRDAHGILAAGDIEDDDSGGRIRHHGDIIDRVHIHGIA